jgi:hypothetical protein
MMMKSIHGGEKCLWFKKRVFGYELKMMMSPYHIGRIPFWHTNVIISNIVKLVPRGNNGTEQRSHHYWVSYAFHWLTETINTFKI